MSTCTEKVNVGGHGTDDGRWVGADLHTCVLTLDEHEVVGEGGRARRVHLDGSTQHAWTTCNGPKHDRGVRCWCARRAA